jgi:hypothetical protein
MAELLKRQYDLIVLKTELLDGAGDENVRFTLQYKEAGELVDVATWTCSTTFIGVGARLDSRQLLGRGPTLQLPAAMLSALTAFFQQETDGDRPLWVHLVKPYGLLRLVAWERLLGDAVHVPVLMLPDFIFPPPLEARDALDAAICASAPLGYEDWSVYLALRRTIDQIVSATPRPLRLHIFTDRALASRLRNENALPAPQPGREITLHDDALAEKYVHEDPSSRLLDHAGALRSPWLLWMREALHGRTIDVMHFICHGYMARDHGALLFAQSPTERTERFLAGPVGATELRTFLTQVGAWSVVLTALPDNYSDPGLRTLADQIAQSRPGPLMLISDDPQQAFPATAAGYRFLYSIEPELPPPTHAVLIYCQPYHVRGASPAVVTKSAAAPSAAAGVARNAVQARVANQAQQPSPLDHLFSPGARVETWVASTQRFAEQVQLRYQQLARDELAPPDKCEHDTKIAMDTVDALRRAVAAHAGQTRGGGTAS